MTSLQELRFGAKIQNFENYLAILQNEYSIHKDHENTAMLLSDILSEYSDLFSDILKD